MKTYSLCSIMNNPKVSVNELFNEYSGLETVLKHDVLLSLYLILKTVAY